MRKYIALVLALTCVLCLIGCSTKDEVIEKQSEFEATVLEVTDHYLLVEPIEGSIELNSSDEIKVGLQDKTSWPIPQVGEMVRVVYDGLIQETDPARIPNPYRVEIIISDENDTIQFHDKVVSKSDLSQETIEWLEKYNELSETEQLSISSIPSDLYKLCGYGNAEDAPAVTE
ncbi:MAG: hypothetical protein IJE90_04475 [Clostridia bacterium]|nr:hypothetical protein [Clostridia bacterium]